MPRALLSVSDKSGLLDLARFLHQNDFEILSTGGTAKELRDQQIPVTLISDYTRSPEILGGRVKTLHPKIFGGILFDRGQPEHVRDAESESIGGIDVVVVNLYPFESTVARPDVTFEQAIEKIDIGGPSLLRAAAKNHRHVIPLCDPALYEEFMKEWSDGVSEEFRRKAALRVFELTSRSDTAIARYLSSLAPRASFQGELHLVLSKAQELRYGENPHQAAAFYIDDGALLGFEQLHGKELSYNNLLDFDAANRLVNAFHDPAAVVIKHTNPAGAACGSSVAEAVRKAVESDPVSAFGGIIGLNREMDAESVTAIGNLFLEVIVAPGFTAEALEALQKKKNLRLIRADDRSREIEIRSAVGGYLVQAADRVADTGWTVMTERHPTQEEYAALRFAWIVTAYVKSNAIVIATGRQTVGVGAGQMSRVDAAKIALMKAVLPTTDTVAGSDAFFPFRDGLDILANAGVRAVVQPGGSMRDAEVIEAANERGVAMVFTGERHFRH